MRSVIKMKSGNRWIVIGSESDVAAQVNAHRGEGKSLIRLERDIIPAGRYVNVDANEVESIRDVG